MKIVYGPYKRKDGRSIVVHYDTVDKRTTSQSYPRYLLEQNGISVDPKLHVDHINEDKTDNRLGNFQQLTPGDNNRKSSFTEYIDLICSECGKEFTTKMKRYRYRIKQNSEVFYCSRSCAGKAAGRESGRSRRQK